MKKTLLMVAFGAVTTLMTGCAVTPGEVAITPPRISIPNVVVYDDYPRVVNRVNYVDYGYEHHDNRNFGHSRGHKRGWNQEWRGGGRR